jgi:dipeptidyl aminopeptidase/acylaminoacyl peptidase
VAALEPDAVRWRPGQMASRYEIGGKPITGSENVFAFRASFGPWRLLLRLGLQDSTNEARTAEVSRSSPSRDDDRDEGRDDVHAAEARFHIRHAAASARRRQAGALTDGKTIAFAAVGDIYTMPVGGKPVNLTSDAALDTDPAWSPDGSQLAYSSDKDSEHLQLWIRDMKTGQAAR